jgi:uncharacterized protein YcfJ
MPNHGQTRKNNMNRILMTAIAAASLLAAAHASAQITFYEGEGFHGRAFTTSNAVPNFARTGFNDRASSVVVDRGRWEICDNARFSGRCAVLRPGSYRSLQALGMNERISSVRPAAPNRQYTNMPEPMASPDYVYRRRANERVFDVPVTSVHAVMGAGAQHCWVERQQVSQPSGGDRNVGGAIAGALIGGVLGHQVGGGTGKDIATVGGAVAGGVIGSNIGRDGNTVSTRDVRRCETTVSGTPAYWDVGYRFKGQDHQVQMSAAPGRSIYVNGNGEPRQ